MSVTLDAVTLILFIIDLANARFQGKVYNIHFDTQASQPIC
jgi:hypothetical protein